MSAEAVAWVFRHSPYRHGAFAVHVALADAANDLHGNEVFFGVARLASKARVGRSTVIATLAQMTRDSLLEEVSQQRGSASPAVYRMLFPAGTPVVYQDGTRPKTGLVQKPNQSKDRPQLVQKPKSSPLIEPKEPKGVSSTRSARISEDFSLTASMREWAQANGIRSDLDDETPRFVDYWVGKGDTRVDWVACWRNWMRNADRFADARPDPTQSKSAAARARVRAQLAASPPAVGELPA